MCLIFNRFRPLPKSLSTREGLVEQNVRSDSLNRATVSPFSCGERVRDRGLKLCAKH